MSGRRIRVIGRVQGVFFRNWTVDAARSLGLTGWVRNRVDGSVEIVAYGEEQALDRLLALCREGPDAARVDRLDVEAADGQAPAEFTREATS